MQRRQHVLHLDRAGQGGYRDRRAWLAPVGAHRLPRSTSTPRPGCRSPPPSTRAGRSTRAGAGRRSRGSPDAAPSSSAATRSSSGVLVRVIANFAPTGTCTSGSSTCTIGCRRGGPQQQVPVLVLASRARPRRPARSGRDSTSAARDIRNVDECSIAIRRAGQLGHADRRGILASRGVTPALVLTLRSRRSRTRAEAAQQRGT